MIKQCLFYNIEEDKKHYGLILDNGDIICACCGKQLKAVKENIEWKMIHVFNDWLNLEESAITGNREKKEL